MQDPATEWAIERGLQVASQSVFDIGNLVLAGAFGVDDLAEFADAVESWLDRQPAEGA